MKSSRNRKQKTPEAGDIVCMPYSMIPKRIFMIVYERFGINGREYILLDNSGHLVSIAEDVMMCTLNIEDEVA